ncbi:MAG: tetratricopeptide repeat protein [Bryobacteraceae bacterium]|jgi:tol-pal system protein YbgF
MNWLRLALAAFLFTPLALGQKREFVELQRDMSTLQDQVRSLERSFNEKMGSLNTLVQQCIDSIGKLSTSMAVLDTSLREREGKLSAPVTALGSKVDQMSSEFQAVRVSIDDLSARLGKLERGLVDLGNVIKVMQTPPTPPPAAPGAGSSSPPSAETLYANAMNDKNGGNFDMALQEFADYLKYYRDTDSAPNAQYYIGEISYNRKDYEGALKAFDAVLEQFPEGKNTKTLDAMFMKGRALMQMGDKAGAAAEFRAVINRYPTSELATKAKAQLAAMNMSATPSGKKAARKAH